MASRFQQLGAFVAVAENLTDEKLAKFAAVGGRYIVVLLAQLGYPDDHDPSCVWNLGNIESLKQRCAEHGIACGAWFNGWALGATEDAVHVSSIVHAHNLGPVMLDLEASYQYPIGDWNQLPALVAAVRKRLPTRGLAVSTNSPNDSMIWNGGQQGFAQSMRALGVRLAPQWYNAPAYGHGTWMRPDQTMEWLRAHGADGNFFDPVPPNHRAVPLSFVHGTLEVTGLESADLAGELAELETARMFGYSVGFSIFTLEACPDSDLDLLAQKRGRLFLV